MDSENNTEKRKPWRANIDISKISPHNMAILDKYINKNISIDMSEHTIGKQKRILHQFLNWVDDRDVETIDDDDIIKYLNYLKTFEYIKNKKGELAKFTPETLYTHRSTIKTFLSTPLIANRTTKTKEPVNQFAADAIELSRKKIDKNKVHKVIFTKTEIDAMIDAALTLRDKALIATFYESGARRDELLSLPLSKVQIHPDGVVIFVKGKTGERRNLLTWASSYIRDWLNTHPDSENPNAPLFCSRVPPHGRICNTDLYLQLKKIAERAGIKKRVHPHMFRHTRITHMLANNWGSPAAINMFVGWEVDSGMVRVYSQLAGNDLDEIVRRASGIEKEDEDDGMKVIKCPRCREVMPKSIDRCSRCWFPFTEKAMAEDRALLAQEAAADKHEMEKHVESLVDQLVREKISAIMKHSNEVLKGKDEKKLKEQAGDVDVWE